MDPITIGLIAAGAGGVSGLLGGISDRKAASERKKNIRQSIAMMEEVMNTPLNGLYGASAGADGMTTGSSEQDIILKLLAEQVQAKELQALAINNATQNLTDREARSEAMRRSAMANQSENNRIMDTAGRNIRRYNSNASDLLTAAARANEGQRTNMRNQAQFATNNNLANIGAGTNLNTGSIASQNRNDAQALMGAYTGRVDAARNNIIGLMNQMPTTPQNPLSSGLSNAATMGLYGGLSAYSSLADAGALAPYQPTSSAPTLQQTRMLGTPDQYNNAVNQAARNTVFGSNYSW